MLFSCFFCADVAVIREASDHLDNIWWLEGAAHSAHWLASFWLRGQPLRAKGRLSDIFDPDNGGTIGVMDIAHGIRRPSGDFRAQAPGGVEMTLPFTWNLTGTRSLSKELGLVGPLGSMLLGRAGATGIDCFEVGSPGKLSDI